VLGALHGETPRPIAALAPDVTWYCMSLSKCFAMGLRVAYLVAPSARAASVLMEPVQNLSSWFPPSLSMLVVADWIRTGLGRLIATAIHDEMVERQNIAARLLTHANYATAPGALHIWLNLPPHADASAFARDAAQAGVRVRASPLFLVDDSLPPPGVRVSLSTPVERRDLEIGLQRLVPLLEAM
jgi:DNA-binding transcriptional MocR family regulator